jgi:hypothetical protein
MRHRTLSESVDKEIRDLYDMCMNKDPFTRPYISDLLSLDFVQRWAKELNILSQ